MRVPGGTLYVPVRKGQAVQIHPAIVDAVRRDGGETRYCLRDSDGPAVWLPASRLTRLCHRLLPGLLPPDSDLDM